MKKLFVVFLASICVLGFALGAFATEIKFAHFYDPMSLKENNDWVQQTFKEFMEANPDIDIFGILQINTQLSGLDFNSSNLVL